MDYSGSNKSEQEDFCHQTLPALYDLENDIALVPLGSRNPLQAVGGEVFTLGNEICEDWTCWNAFNLEQGTTIAKLGRNTGITLGTFYGVGETQTISRSTRVALL